MSEAPRPLRIFLCHSSGDKQAVRALYKRLRANGFDPWIDEENLLPGQDWGREIAKAVRACDIVLVCLSRDTINKKGFVQKEIKYALDVADEQPEDTTYLIPLKLEECDIPERLRRWHCVNLFEARAEERLMNALRRCAEAIPVIPNTHNPRSSNTSTSISVRQKRAADVSESAGEVEESSSKRGAEASSYPKTYFFDQVIRSLQDSGMNPNRNAEYVRAAIAGQAQAERVQRKVARPKRIPRLVWVGLGVIVVLGMIVGIKAISRLNINLDVTSNLQQGYDCYQKKDYDCAIEFYTKTIRLTPKSSAVYYNRANAYVGKGDYDQAIRDYNRAIELYSLDSDFYYNRGFAYLMKGNYDEAIIDYSKAIKLNPLHAEAYRDRALVYEKLGLPAKAQADNQKYDELSTEK